MGKKKNEPAKTGGCLGGCIRFVAQGLLGLLVIGVILALLPRNSSTSTRTSLTRQPTRVAAVSTATAGRTIEPPQLTRTAVEREPAALPTNTPRPTATPRSTNTPIPTLQAAGALPAIPHTPTPTVFRIAVSARTNTPAPLPTVTPRSQPTATVAVKLLYVYSNQNVNARAEPFTYAAILASIAPGTAVELIGEAEGASVNGNTRWYHVLHDGEPVYVHSTLLRDTAGPLPAPVQQSAPPAQPPAPSNPPAQPAQQQVEQPAAPPPTQVPVQPIDPPPQSTVPPPPPPPPQPASGFQCNGIDDLNCGHFSSRAAAQAHLNACGNEDRLDGNDNDGLACESLP